MSPIVKYACEELGGAEICCLMVKGDPWFKGIEVAKVLGHKNESDAIYRLVPPKFKSKLRFLLSKLCLRDSQRQSMVDQDAYWITEAGLYRLVFNSRVKSAQVFTDWVCAEVLPSIRKTGSYSTYRYSRNENELGTTKQERWKTVRELAVGKEDELH